MRKVFNFILVVLIFVFLVLLCAPVSDIDKKADVYVEHEWDKLESVIIGSPKMFTVPGYHKNMEFRPEYVNADKELIKKVSGKAMAEIDPYFYAQLIEQTDNIVNLLQTQNITIQRLNPEVLSVEELRLMKDIQVGQNYLYPRDSVLVIGNHIIETSSKIPMRVKDKYIARKIFKPFLKENPKLRYVAMPEVSPSFPDTGIYLEGSDVIIDGYDIYVGVSGWATNLRGVAWLQRYLGPKYKVHVINLQGCRHLDEALMLVKPKLGIIARGSIIGELPKPLHRWDFIEVTPDEAKDLGASILIIGPDKVLVDDRCESMISQLRAKSVDVTSVAISAITSSGEGLRSFHQPIKRSYVEEFNKQKLSKESIKNWFNDSLEYVKTLDYKQLLMHSKDKVMNIFKR